MSTTPHLPLQLHCKHLISLFQKSISQSDPAFWLHKHNAREALFMTESLARILESTLQDEKMAKAGRLFKKLEDLLGVIDDCDHLAKQFATYTTVKEKEVDYFLRKRDKTLKKLNHKLIKKEFYQKAFYNVLKHLEVNFNDPAMVLMLRQQLQEEMSTCYKFYSAFSAGFTDMEAQVHEIRRKLRWFSLYGQSFAGSIVLKKNKHRRAWEKKYVLKADLSSPYNKLPVHKHLKAVIQFDQAAFYALNKVIDDLDVIKNKGLGVEALAKAIHKTQDKPKEASVREAARQLKTGYSTTGLLEEAHTLLSDFFDAHGIHNLLLV